MAVIKSIAMTEAEMLAVSARTKAMQRGELDKLGHDPVCRATPTSPCRINHAWLVPGGAAKALVAARKVADTCDWTIKFAQADLALAEEREQFQLAHGHDQPGTAFHGMREEMRSLRPGVELSAAEALGPAEWMKPTDGRDVKSTVAKRAKLTGLDTARGAVTAAYLEWKKTARDLIDRDGRIIKPVFALDDPTVQARLKELQQACDRITGVSARTDASIQRAALVVAERKRAATGFDIEAHARAGEILRPLERDVADAEGRVKDARAVFEAAELKFKAADGAHAAAPTDATWATYRETKDARDRLLVGLEHAERARDRMVDEFRGRAEAAIRGVEADVQSAAAACSRAFEEDTRAAFARVADLKRALADAEAEIVGCAESARAAFHDQRAGVDAEVLSIAVTVPSPESARAAVASISEPGTAFTSRGKHYAVAALGGGERITRLVPHAKDLEAARERARIATAACRALTDAGHLEMRPKVVALIVEAEDDARVNKILETVRGLTGGELTVDAVVAQLEEKSAPTATATTTKKPRRTREQEHA